MFASARIFAPRMGAQANDLVNFITDAATRGMVEDAVWQQFLVVFGGPERPHRTQLMGLQLLAEIGVVLGRDALALDALEQADRFGLCDVVVLDHCPLFESMTSNSRFRALRTRVADRASQVLAAFRSTAG